MNQRDWQRIKDIVGDALDLDPGAREVFLRQSFALEPHLEPDVRQLLALDDSTSDFLRLPDSVEPLPTHIGNYHVLSETGRGGMGVVYLAERNDGQFHQRVAIKRIKRGMDSDLILRRFLAERQILARLEHPNIVRLLDGGLTDSGQPYFVTEFIDGLPIDAYCDAHSLTVAQRIQLLLPICDAVSYAHSKLILHRDLKAANVLVTTDGTPKLLDFGIAKLLSPDAGEPQTQTFLAPMTPQSASPEQLRGEPLSTATDVYGLGRLLTKILPPALPRDLAIILGKATATDPAQRYQSPLGLREDLDRFLRAEPILARPASLRYRLVKWTQRNRKLATLSALLLLAIIAGIGATIFQARRADRRFNQLRSLAKSVAFDLHDEVAKLPGSLPARELIVKQAMAYYEGLEREAGSDTGLLLEAAQGYARLGEIQGNREGANTGDLEGAAQSLRRAEAIFARAPQNIVGPKRALARIQGRLSLVDVSRRNFDSAIVWAQKALANQQQLLAAAPPDKAAEERLGLASRFNELAFVYLLKADMTQAMSNVQQAKSIAEQALQQSPNDPNLQLRLSGILKRATQIFARSGHRAEAVESASRSRSIDEALLAKDPANPRYRNAVAIDYDILGRSEFFRGDPAKAAAYFEKALDIHRALAAANPGDDRPGNSIRLGAANLAQALAKAGRPKEARAAAASALQLAQAYQSTHPGPFADTSLATAWAASGDAWAADSQKQKAAIDYEKARALLLPLAKEGKASIDDQQTLRELLARLGPAPVK